MTNAPADVRTALQRASWRLRLGLRPEDDLVALAVDALVAGLDGAALAELAGADALDSHDRRDMFVDVLGEQGLQWPDEQDALWGLLRHTAQEIVDGAGDPVEGARWLWSHASDRAEPEGDLRIFIGLVSELDDDPGHRDHYEREIIREAAALLERGRPRRWLRVKADTDHPLSVATTGGQVPVDARGLRLPDGLCSQVFAWSREWQAVLSSGGFASASAAEAFVDAGGGIASSLQAALGETWRVEYYPEPIRPPGLRLRKP